MLSISCYFFPYFLLLTRLRPQELSRKGYVSKPPLPEARKANRLHAEAVKKRKDKAKETATRKRERKENHNRACARSRGVPPPPTPESTEEEDSSTGGVDFSEPDDF